MNFCPSCAPCMNAMAAAPAICARRSRPFLCCTQSFSCFIPSFLCHIQHLPPSQPKENPKTPEAASPYNTFIHSMPLIPDKPLCMAIAAPVNPAISAWLSLVGIPKHHAAADHRIMEVSAAHKAVRAFPGEFPKSTIWQIV